jgi:hypothetical protein
MKKGRMMRILKATEISHSEDLEGRDYFQVLFKAGADHADGYVLLQRQFEMPDGGKSYFECDEFERTGHYVIKHARLDRNSLTILIPGDKGGKWEIQFEINDERYEALKEVLGIVLGKPSRLIVTDAG